MAFQLLDLLFFVGFVSAGLAFSIAYLMLISFRAIRSDHLLGFPIGFSFLGISYLFLGTPFLLSLPENLTTWVHLFLGSYGFVFLASAYFFKKRTSSGWSRNIPSLTFFVLSLGATFAVMIAVISLPTISYEVADGAFRVLNLGLLGYVIYNLNQALKDEVELSSVVLGFTFLAIEQYSFLLWSLARTFVWSFVFAQLVRIAGLVILVAFIMRGFQRV